MNKANKFSIFVFGVALGMAVGWNMPHAHADPYAPFCTPQEENSGIPNQCVMPGCPGYIDLTCNFHALYPAPKPLYP